MVASVVRMAIHRIKFHIHTEDNNLAVADTEKIPAFALHDRQLLWRW